MRLRVVLVACLALLCGIPTSSLAQGFHSVYSKDAVDVWAVGDGGLYYRSFNGGATWTVGSISDKPLRAVAAHGLEVIAAGDSGKIWHSSDNGLNWNLTVIAGAPALRGLAWPSPLTAWMVGAGGTILATADGGVTWTPQTSGTSSDLNAVHFNDVTYGWAVGADATVLQTTDGGTSWMPVLVGATAELFDVDEHGIAVWVVGADGTARRSMNGGSDWEVVDLKLDARADVRAVWLASESEVHLAGGGGFIRSSLDGGSTWTYPIHRMQGPISSIHFAGANGRGWACSNRNRALLVTNSSGIAWDFPNNTTVNRTWQQKLPFSGNVRGNTFALNPVHKNTIYVALGARVYRSGDEGETWAAIGNPIPSSSALNAFIMSPEDSNLMLAAVGVSSPKRIVKSIDGGLNWTTVLTHSFGDFGIPLEIHPARPDTFYFGGDSDGLFRSIDKGDHWTEISGSNFRSPCDIVVVPDSSEVILVGDGVTTQCCAAYQKSIDGGLNFTLVSQRPAGTNEIPGMACSRLRNSQTFGTNWGAGGVQISNDYGGSWPTASTVASAWGVDIARDDPNVVVYGVYSGSAAYLSFDAGTTFHYMPITGFGSNYSFYARDRGTILSEQSNGVWKLVTTYVYTPDSDRLVTVISPNGGEVWRANTNHPITWSSTNIPLLRIEYRRSAADPWQYVAGVEGNQNAYLWNVPLDLTTEAEVRMFDAGNGTPLDASDGTFTIDEATVAAGDPGIARFALRQNQPNPFTRTTHIRYALPVDSPVSLEVYDLRGQRVATLVSATQGPGEYAVAFGPGTATATGERVGDVPAGMYFYRFQAGGFASVRKMLVLR